jgi:L-glyceraldehyde 3-phosphate reductase
MSHEPSPSRYANPNLYRRCGRSGLILPAISLGLWHNFGTASDFATSRALVLRAFDLGITHFDLANNYGPPPGAAEATFGRILREDLAAHRDEIIVSTKAGYTMWTGPYGDWGSRKHLIASLDQSLRRLGLDYVDLFYSHRPDPETPLDETMGALAQVVRQGKALYPGLSNYPADRTSDAARALRSLGTPCLLHQPRYNLLERSIEAQLSSVLQAEGIGAIAFCPLAQGLLTERYVGGVPADSRAGHDPRFLKPEHVTPQVMEKVARLRRIAAARGQSLAQMSLAWVLRRPEITSALIGASRPAQIEENVAALRNTSFSREELDAIDSAVAA